MEIKEKLWINPNIEINSGNNFLNIDSKQYRDKQYYLNLFVKIDMDLEETTENLIVETDLPVFKYRWEDLRLDKFLKDLNINSKKPFFKVKIGSNRKNKLITWGDIEHLTYKIREHTIIFNDIEINISDLAEKKLKKLGMDFKAEVKRILNQQKPLNIKKQKFVNRFIYLKEKVLTLKTFLEEKSNYGYYSDNKKDKTLKILITAEQYNKKLKEIEKEMLEIAKEFNFELDEFEYLTIEQKVDYDTWLNHNEESLQDSWESTDESELTFEEYCKMCYDESDKVIEVQNNE